MNNTDEDEFGTTTKILRKSFFSLPVLYTNRLPNANELSTDFFFSSAV